MSEEKPSADAELTVTAVEGDPTATVGEPVTVAEPPTVAEPAIIAEPVTLVAAAVPTQASAPAEPTTPFAPPAPAAPFAPPAPAAPFAPPAPATPFAPPAQSAPPAPVEPLPAPVPVAAPAPVPAEAVKTEAIEAIKTEAIKTEAIKTEAIKTEAIKTEAIKTEPMTVEPAEAAPPTVLAPAAPEVPKRRRGLLAAAVFAVALVLLLGAIGFVVYQKVYADPTRDASVGSCLADLPVVAVGEDKAANAARIVGCTDDTAAFEVQARVNNQTEQQARNPDICKAFPDATFVYRAVPEGGTGYVLCLKKLGE